jgi:hypothetical protein
MVYVKMYRNDMQVQVCISVKQKCILKLNKYVVFFTVLLKCKVNISFML